MAILLVAVLYGLVFAFFATQNTGPITLRIGNLVYTIPVYMLSLGSLILGIIISSLISFIDSLSNSWDLRKREGVIKESDQEIRDLREKIYQLEVENARLKGDYQPRREVYSAPSPHQSSGISWFDKLRHKLSY